MFLFRLQQKEGGGGLQLLWRAAPSSSSSAASSASSAAAASRVLLPVDPVPLLHRPQLLLLLLGAHLAAVLRGVVVENDQVAVLHVEAAEVVARLLGVVDVLKDDIGGAPGVLLGAPVLDWCCLVLFGFGWCGVLHAQCDERCASGGDCEESLASLASLASPICLLPPHSMDQKKSKAAHTRICRMAP